MKGDILSQHVFNPMHRIFGGTIGLEPSIRSMSWNVDTGFTQSSAASPSPLHCMGILYSNDDERIWGTLCGAPDSITNCSSPSFGNIDSDVMD